MRFSNTANFNLPNVEARVRLLLSKLLISSELILLEAEKQVAMKANPRDSGVESISEVISFHILLLDGVMTGTSSSRFSGVR